MRGEFLRWEPTKEYNALTLRSLGACACSPLNFDHAADDGQCVRMADRVAISPSLY